MSSSPKRRAHVWHSMNSKKEVVMKSNNENEAPAFMAELCAIGFIIALALVVTGLAYALEYVLFFFGVIDAC